MPLNSNDNIISCIAYSHLRNVNVDTIEYPITHG